MNIEAADIAHAIADSDRHAPKVVANAGGMVVVTFEDRVFICNRMNGKIAEISPDWESGFTIQFLGDAILRRQP